MNVIDFGAGSGAYDELLLSRGIGEITLVDASEKMLVKAREKLKNAGLEDRATCVKSRLDELEYDEWVISTYYSARNTTICRYL